MNVGILYLLLVKATLTSFSGLASLPMLHRDLVVERHVLTEHELNTAVAVGRMGPGPLGLYVVSVGYFSAGIPGAIAGFMALVTPAFLAVPLLYWVGPRAAKPRVKGAISAVVLAGGGLLLATTLPLARDAVKGPLTAAIVIVSFVLLAFTKISSVG
jgi:chromate transporter